MNKYLVVGVLCLVLVTIGIVMHFGATSTSALHPGVLPTKEVSVGSTSVKAEIAATPAQWEQGLSGRKALPAGMAMLFVFPAESQTGFWMKDMNFSLDIIWADKDGTIVTIAQDIAPETYPHIFYPSTPALYVLEVPAGFALQHAIAEGQKIVVQ